MSSIETGITPEPPVFSSISYVANNRPVWDFAATTAYPIEIPQGDKVATPYVYLTPYESTELRDILRKATFGYRREKRDMEIVRDDSGIYTPMFDAHFIKLGNSTGTPDQQKAWFDRFPEHKSKIIEVTFGGLEMKRQEATGTDEIFDIFADFMESTKVHQSIYDDSTGNIVRVEMIHKYSHPTEGQFRQYRNSRRSKFSNRSALWTVTESHATLEKLYDEVIQSIEGAQAAGKPCIQATKSEWLPKVPLFHKLLVVDQAFSDLIEKNE